MFKLKTLLVSLSLSLSLIFLPFLAFAADETLTITTYYPSPYGSYNQFKVASNTWLAYSSGSVGIGTTGPLALLHVNKSGTSDQEVARFMAPSGNAYITIGAEGTGVNQGGAISWNSDANAIEIREHSSVVSLVVNDGNVGIGTTSPVTKLQVGTFAFTGGDLPSIGAITTNINSASATTNGDTGYQLTLTESSALGANKGGGIGFQAVYDVSNNVTTIAGIKGLRENATASDQSGYLSFLTRGATGSAAERVRINSSGNVGIGTVAPTALLHVQKDQTALTSLDVINDSNSAGAAARLRVSVGGPLADDPLVMWGISNGTRAYAMGIRNSDSDKLVITTAATSTANLSDTRLVTIQSDGNVGIGTTDISYPLVLSRTTTGRVFNINQGTDATNVFYRFMVDTATPANTIAYADGSWAGGGADYAEWFEKEEDIPHKALIGLNLKTGKVRVWQEGDPFVGVQSVNPGFIGNNVEAEIEPADMEQRHVLVALVGQVEIVSDSIVEEGRRVSTKDGQFIGWRLSDGKVFIK